MQSSIKPCALFLLVSISSVSHSEDTPNWAVRCETEGDKRCYLVQNVFLAENQQRLAGLAIRREGEGYLIVLTTPLGVDLPGGAHIRLDEAAPLAVAYQTCSQQGCHGALMLDKERFKSWKRAKNLVVSYQDTSGRRIGVPFSLKDFANGLEQLKSPPRAAAVRRSELPE